MENRLEHNNNSTSSTLIKPLSVQVAVTFSFDIFVCKRVDFSQVPIGPQGKLIAGEPRWKTATSDQLNLDVLPGGGARWPYVQC